MFWRGSGDVFEMSGIFSIGTHKEEDLTADCPKLFRDRYFKLRGFFLGTPATWTHLIL